MSKFIQKIRNTIGTQRLPWTITAVILFFALVYEIVNPLRFDGVPKSGQLLFWALTLLSLLIVYLFAKRVEDFNHHQNELTEQARRSEQAVNEAYSRLQAIFRVSQKFVDASDENEVVAPVLRLLVDLAGARGASFVPLDEHGQPQMALSHGELPETLKSTWSDYLLSNGVRERCANCELHDTLARPLDCPLIEGPFSSSSKLLCLPVFRGERNFGVLTLFFSNDQDLDDRSLVYLRTLVDETAFGLDSVRLRRRELAALRQMQILRQKTELNVLLEALLANVHRTLETDFALMLVPKSGQMSKKFDLICGDLPSQARLFLDGILQGVMASAEPVMLGDVSGEPNALSLVKALAAAPLLSSDGQVVGAILVGNHGVKGFNQRQLALLQTVAGQVALVVQNANLMAELEYKTMIQERTRLAREIHDGLAQTIGFLKLQVAQMSAFFSRGDMDRLKESIETVHQTLSEAYQDARQAIDGLRIETGGSGLAGWVEQTSREFQEISGLQVSLDVEDETPLPAEVQAQLIRILQEALSNIRKHADAQQVWILCREIDDDFILEIRDDGVGFTPDDITGAARYGLQGMRERADLIRADFQVISQPLAGATIRVRLPLRDVGEAVI